MQDVIPTKHREYKDNWETENREGYEDRGPVRPVRTQQHEGGSMLKTLGGLAIVGGILWVTYLVTQTGSIGSLSSILQQNHGPVAIIGLGAIASLLGKYLRI